MRCTICHGISQMFPLLKSLCSSCNLRKTAFGFLLTSRAFVFTSVPSSNQRQTQINAEILPHSPSLNQPASSFISRESCGRQPLVNFLTIKDFVFRSVSYSNWRITQTIPKMFPSDNPPDLAIAILILFFFRRTYWANP